MVEVEQIFEGHRMLAMEKQRMAIEMVVTVVE